MLKIVGIIAEYDPFHAGHAWQIARARQAGAEAVVCVMSPSVVQRGAFALFPAQVRVRAALAGGADLVLCLPAPYAVLSAEGFAAAGVRILSSLGCVDTLCFGAETPDAALLRYLASGEARLDKLFEDPTLLRTPIVRNGKQATVGYCPQVWETWS